GLQKNPHNGKENTHQRTFKNHCKHHTNPKHPTNHPQDIKKPHQKHKTPGNQNGRLKKFRKQQPQQKIM
ncbi:hypothetical protein, partial [Salmonella enterica]|uniref:hypothetical protein n=1 Tax=Salmonella enterica TaxID=28901 RepID=UPI0020C4A8D7